MIYARKNVKSLILIGCNVSKLLYVKTTEVTKALFMHERYDSMFKWQKENLVGVNMVANI